VAAAKRAEEYWLEAEVRAAEREVLAAKAAAVAARAVKMYSDGMGVTEEAAEAAFWGMNAIPEGGGEDDREKEREGTEEDGRWARSMRSVGLCVYRISAHCPSPLEGLRS
jgi:hypothetical protein